jgi:hypothetical protein
MEIIPYNYKDIARSRFSVTAEELSNNDIEDSMTAEIADVYIKKRIPDYASVTDESDLLMMQMAAVSYMCHLLCPSMPGRVMTEIATLDVKWKKDKIDWKTLEQKFLNETEAFLSKISTVTVTEPSQAPIITKITTTRNPIGGTG